MNKSEKLLRKVSKEDRRRLELTIALIYANNLDMLDVKKISGSENIFRVRVGKFRIKFIAGEIHNKITEVTRRSDNTY